MSATPLMSGYPVDKKEELFVAQLDEPDVELVVGGQPARRRCFWSRFRGCNNACAARSERKPRSFIGRLIRVFLVLAVFFTIAGPSIYKRLTRFHEKKHPIVCVPVIDTSSTTILLPLHSWRTHIGLHPSLTTGDVKITHSDDVEEGHVQINFALPDDTELLMKRDDDDDDEEAKVFACSVAGRHYVGAGVHANTHHHKKPEGDEPEDKEVHLHERKEGEHHKYHRHHKGPKAISTTVTLSSSDAGKARPISLLGYWPRHRFGHKCLKKRISKAIAKAVRAARAEKLVGIEHLETED